MANIITGIRIVISAVLLFCPVLSPAFYILYIIAGITDIADGAVARRIGTVCEFGSRLDTIADIIFVAICLIKVLPVLDVGEALVVGDASLLPSRIIIRRPSPEPNSSTVKFWNEWAKEDTANIIPNAVESMQRQSKIQ